MVLRCRTSGAGRLLALGIVFGLFLAAPLRAETGTLLLRVEARLVRTLPEEPEQLHWVLVGSSVATLGNARGKADLERQLARAAQALSEAKCKAQVLGARSACNLLFRVDEERFIFDLGSLDTPPTMAAAAKPFTVTFEYTEPQRSILQQLTVRVRTESAGLSNSKDSLVTLTHAQAMQRLSRPPVPELQGVTIQLHYTAADRSRGQAMPFPSTRIENTLLETAILALGTLQREGFVPQNPIPDEEDALAKLDSFIDNVLSSGIRNWPDAHANVQYLGADRTTAQVEIRVRIVASAGIVVERGEIPDEKGELVSFVGDNPRLEREIREDLRHAETALAAAFQSQLEQLEGSVPNASQVAELREGLRKRREIAGSPRVEASDSNVVFKATRAWVLGKLDTKITASFTPEDLLTGEGTLTGEKLLYNLFGRDIGETYSYTLRAGTTLQDTEFVLGFPRTRGTHWIADYGGDVTALYLRDSKQLLGASGADTDGKLTEREKGFKPRAYFEIRKQVDAKSVWTSVTRIDALLDLRNLLLRPNSDSFELTNGRLTAPTLRLRHGFGYAPEAAAQNGAKGGLANIMLNFTTEARKGVRRLGGDFNFRQYLVTGTVESFFGFRSRRDFLVRYRRGFGASSVETPLYQFFRLGGTSSLRGIEEGEFFGRGISFAQIDAGVSARLIWNFIRHLHPSPPGATSTEASPSLPISLDQIYIAALYDRAAVSNSPRLGELLKLQKTFSGRGIAAELRGFNAGSKRANLSIGYARSPQSIIHRKGLMTVGVSFDLF